VIALHANVVVPLFAIPLQFIRSSDSALLMIIPKALPRWTLGWPMACHSCIRPDEVDCTVNKTLAVCVFTFYLLLLFIATLVALEIFSNFDLVSSE